MRFSALVVLLLIVIAPPLLQAQTTQPPPQEKTAGDIYKMAAPSVVLIETYGEDGKVILHSRKGASE